MMFGQQEWDFDMIIKHDETNIIESKNTDLHDSST
jgi:hypothetical protein